MSAAVKYTEEIAVYTKDMHCLPDAYFLRCLMMFEECSNIYIYEGYT